jgi:hypothetical protein
MNSWKLATEECLPHAMVVRKLKKFKKYKDKPLVLNAEGRHDGETIYSFDEKHYNSCKTKEKKAVASTRSAQQVQAKKNFGKQWNKNK